MAFRCPYKIKTGSAQIGLRDPDQVDTFKREMLEGRWDYEGLGKHLVYWREGNTIYVSDGHHRVNAALEIGWETGDWNYLDRLLEYGKQEPDLPPPGNIGRFSTRRWWSRLLDRMGI